MMELSNPDRPDSPRRDADRGFRPDIEGLRGLAILLVVAYHAGVPGFTGGYAGVDVFFVLSGYLITGLLIEEIRNTGRVDFWAFYARRARRLLPAAFTVLVATLLVGRILYAPVDHNELAKTGLATALYISNLFFARSATDYLAHSDPSPLLHTWSLAVEEQFYLFWPLIVLIAFLGLRKKADSRRLAFTMIAMGVASLGFSIWLTGVSQPYAFFLLPTRAWEFACGALAKMTQPAWSRESRAPHALSWLGFLAVLATGVTFNAETAFPGVAAALPVFGTAFLLSAGAINVNAGPLRLLANNAVQWIGRVSYSWYLWHWPVLIYARSFPQLRGLVPSVLLALLGLALAGLTHAVIENPIRFNKKLVKRPRLSLAGALVLTITGAGAAAWTRAAGAQQAAAPAQAIYSEARDLPVIYSDGCHATQLITELERCEYGDTTAASAIVLFGDSHAAQWFPALERIARENRLKLVSFTKSACPAAHVELENQQMGRVYTECSTWRAAAARRILELRPIAVVLSNFSGYIEVPGSGGRWTTTRENWRSGVERLVATFDSAGIRTVLLADTPLPGFDVPSCLARVAWSPLMHEDRCEFPRSSERNRIAHSIDREIANSFSKASIVDLTEAVCEFDVCRPEVDGVVRYRDAHHLTTRFAASLAPLLSDHILNGNSNE